MQEGHRNDIVAVIKNDDGIDGFELTSATFFDKWRDDIYFEYDKNKGVFPTDYLANNIGWLLVSEKLKNIIEKLNCEVQFIKVKVKEKHGEAEYDYYIANVLTAVSALDLEHSKYTESDINGKVIRFMIFHAVYEEKVNGKDLFMLSETIDSGTWYGSGLFRKLYREEKLTGIEFREIAVY